MKEILYFVMISLFVFPVFTFAESSQVPSGLAKDQVEEKVDDIMDNYIGEDIPGAAIAVVKDGEVLLQKGYGMSDIEKDEAVDPENTVFEAGSISKLYTWSAVMQLVEQEKLDLEEDVRTYLPENYLELEFDDKITMRHLMNHTAGFEDKADQLLTQDPEKVIPLEDFVSKDYGQPKQVFHPGKVTSYSNFGASLAGYIIEQVSGEDYADYMQEHVLDELGMKHSSFKSNYSDLPDITDFKGESYEKKGDAFEIVDWAYVNDAPAGSLNTTAADMAQFMLAQLDSDEYRLFDQKNTLEDMHEQTYQVHDQLPGNAHGFWERYVNDHRVLEHGGNVIGYTSQLELVPEEDFGFAILMNVADEMSGVRVDLIQELIGEVDKPNQVSNNKNDQKVEGTYRMARGVYSNFLKLLPVVSNVDVTIKQDDQGGITLHSAIAPEPVHYTETENLLYERADDTRTLLDQSGMDNSRIAFELDEKDNVVKMTYGVMSDYLPVAVKDRADVNMIVIFASILTFLVYTIILVIRWAVRKQKKRDKMNLFPAVGLLSGTGLLTFINVIVLYGRYIADPFQPLAGLQWQAWINWLLPVAIIVSAYFLFKQFHKTKLLVKCAHLFLIVVSCIFVLFLWNFQLI